MPNVKSSGRLALVRAPTVDAEPPAVTPAQRKLVAEAARGLAIEAGARVLRSEAVHVVDVQGREDGDLDVTLAVTHGMRPEDVHARVRVVVDDEGKLVRGRA